MMGLAASFTAALLLGLALVPLCRGAARRLGYVSAPRPDRWRSAPTPLLGGVAVGATVVGLAPVAGQAAALAAPLGCALAMGAVGLVDDVRPLRPWAKLVLEIAIAAVLVYGGYRLHWLESLTGDTLLTLFWIVGITNAFNLLDNMDGLCAGVAVIAGATLLATIGGAPDNPDTVYLALLVGACAAFLVYNFAPASVFLGDSGALFIGASLAAVTLERGSAAAGRPDVLAVVAAPTFFVLLLPIFDTTLVTVSRLLSGRSPSTGGRDHSSHRLAAVGLSERQAVAVLWGLAAAGGALGVTMRHVPPEWSLLFGALFLLATVLFAVWLMQVRVGDKDAEASSGGEDAPLLRRVIEQTRAAEVVLDLCLVAIAYYAAYRLRFEGDAWGDNFPIFYNSLPIVVAVQMLALVLTGGYRGVWRHFGLVDAVVCARGVAAGTVSIFIVLLLAFRFAGYSRTVFVVYALLLLLLLVASRASFRLLGEFFHRRREHGARVVVYGAGDAGVLALQEVAGPPESVDSAGSAPRMVGFVDDDARRHGRRVHGYPVLGGYDRLVALVRAGEVDVVVLSDGVVEGGRLRELSDLCAGQQVSLSRLHVEVRRLVGG